MRLIITIVMLALPMYAFADKAPKPFQDSDIKRKLDDGTVQKFDGNKYKIVPRHGKKKAKPVAKKQKDDCGCSNRVSMLAGYGALGNLKADETSVRTENGLVLGLQYMRDFKDDGFHLLIQAQTNETFSVGAGIDF